MVALTLCYPYTNEPNLFAYLSMGVFIAPTLSIIPYVDILHTSNNVFVCTFNGMNRPTQNTF